MESFPSPSQSHVEVKDRGDGVKMVVLLNGTDKITCIMRDGSPFITSSTGQTVFERLNLEDQKLVRNALM